MIGKIFSGIFRGLDILRKFLHLVLLLVIFGILVGALRTSIPHIADRSALVIQPRGEIVEQLTGSPVDQALAKAQGNAQAETLLWDLTDAIKAAKKDARITAVVLDLNYMAGGGQPTLAELTAAIRGFPFIGQEGRRVFHGLPAGELLRRRARPTRSTWIRWVSWASTATNAIARTTRSSSTSSACDVNLFRVGAYKSAAEVYVRNDMSPEDREDSLAYLTALWLNYRTAVAEGARAQARGHLARTSRSWCPACSPPRAMRPRWRSTPNWSPASSPRSTSNGAWSQLVGATRPRTISRRSRPTRATPASRTTPRRWKTTCASCTPRKRRAARASPRSASSSRRARSSTARSLRERWAARPPPR